MRVGDWERRDKDVLTTLGYLDPDAAPLFMILSHGKHRSVPRPTWRWRNADGSRPTNHAQLLCNQFGATATASSVETLRQHRDGLRLEFGAYHLVELERVLMLGARRVERASWAEDGVRIQERRLYTGGVAFWATENQFQHAGAEVLDAWIERLFAQGSAQRVLFLSPDCRALMLGHMVGMRPVSIGETYGIRLDQWDTEAGRFLVIQHRLLRGTEGYAVDLGKLRLRTHLSPTLRTNLQLPHLDGWKDEFRSEVGLEIRDRQLHGSLR